MKATLRFLSCYLSLGKISKTQRLFHFQQLFRCLMYAYMFILNLMHISKCTLDWILSLRFIVRKTSFSKSFPLCMHEKGLCIHSFLSYFFSMNFQVFLHTSSSSKCISFKFSRLFRVKSTELVTSIILLHLRF